MSRVKIYADLSEAAVAADSGRGNYTADDCSRTMWARLETLVD
jgi:hypothetical protein